MNEFFLETMKRQDAMITKLEADLAARDAQWERAMSQVVAEFAKSGVPVNGYEMAIACRERVQRGAQHEEEQS